MRPLYRLLPGILRNRRLSPEKTSKDAAPASDPVSAEAPREPGAASSGDVDAYVASLLAAKALRPAICHHRVIPATDAEYAEPIRPLPRAVAGLLAASGARRLYSHQAAALDLARSGRNVAVATPTASGKTLIYNLPVIERIFSDPDARALYLFPLKALAQDQLRAFSELTSSLPASARPAAAIYDGDTPSHERSKLRKNPPHVLMTNPEMLHLSMLPHHETWAEFFAGLSFVVVDEMHTYRGVMGSHMAHVFRRLLRICARYGSAPVFIFCSATVGNPGELAQALTNLPAVAVTRSGAPAGDKHVVFVNPVESAAHAAIMLLRAALERDLRAIVYTGSRKMTELISIWAAERAGRFKDKISAYRSGFLPEERRDIEARMTRGELLAVVSTSALELGIDIGGLDVCILAGYPGSIMSTWQRAGRVGRAGRASLLALIAGEDALDQYFMRHPEDFFDRPPESAVINPANPVIAARHIECAAAERPLALDEPYAREEAVRELIGQMISDGRLLLDAAGERVYSARKRPHREVDLRGSGSRYRIEDAAGGETIGEIDEFRAFRETHPGAVYLHRGRTYVVETMDLATRLVRARPASVDYYTRSRGRKQTEILCVAAERAVFGTCAAQGRLKVREEVTGYERRRVRGGALLGVVPLDLPPLVFETEGFWFTIPEAVQREADERMLHFMGGIHAVEHAAIGILPLLVLADRNDFGGISTPLHPELGRAAIFIYDGMPGGVGLSREAFDRAEELLRRTLAVIRDCPCETGCPSCVHSPKCGSGNRPIDKDAAKFVIEEMIAAPPPPDRPAGERRAPEPPAPQAGGAGAENAAPVRKSGSATASPIAASGPDKALPSATKGRAKTPAAKGGVMDNAPGRFAVFDLETRRSAEEVGGWGNAANMGVSVAVLYDSGSGEFREYLQDDVAVLAEDLRAFDLIVGFNIKRFDYLVLSGLHDFDYHGLPTLDMLDEVRARLGYRLSLDSLATATLQTPKSASGLEALAWWKQGRVREIADYCRKDVEITRDLYLYGRDHGHLLFRNKAGALVRAPVAWR
ncbi:MAG: DEAD/DEAH box helicase [Desulfovibrionaceae bacterium]|nr:DEAD/DEAH box helicase [Desulfovibrionaceae bacterium]